MKISKQCAKSPRAQKARQILVRLQQFLEAGLLDATSESLVNSAWEGEARHGVSLRPRQDALSLFNSGVINFMQEHREKDFSSHGTSSRTSLAAVLNPDPPTAPSLHFHASFTEHRNGATCWRLVVDFNSTFAQRELEKEFAEVLKESADRGFMRGIRRVGHGTDSPLRPNGTLLLNISEFGSGDFRRELEVVEKFSLSVFEMYITAFKKAALSQPPVEPDARLAQIKFNSTRLFQILAVDKATTFDLLLGRDQSTASLIPTHVDSAFLSTFFSSLGPDHKNLLVGLIEALGEPECPGIRAVEEDRKSRVIKLAKKYYRTRNL